MANFFLRSRPTTNWAASTVYVLGDRRKSTGTVPALGIHFEVTTAGTSAAAEPTWNTTVGGTTTDNTVTWTTRGSANTWVALTAYVAGDRVVATTAATAARQVFVFECTTGGTSGTAEPSWSVTVGGTQADATVTWTVREATTWNNAHIFIGQFTASATSSIAAGDTLFVGDEHAETTAAAVSISLRGTALNPCRVICVNDTGDPSPPTLTATTASIATTGANNLSIASASEAYIFGISFKAGDAAGAANVQIGATTNVGTAVICDTCTLALNTTNVANQIVFGLAAASSQGRVRVLLKNTVCNFGAVGQTIQPRDASFSWLDTSAAIGGTVPTILITPAGQGVGNIVLEGLDLSAIVAGKSLITLSNGNHQVLIRNCRIGTGALTTGTHPGADGMIFRIINVDSAATRTVFRATRPFGTISEELTNVRSGGANNGLESFAWKLVSTSGAQRTYEFLSFPIQKWNTLTGAVLKATVEILHDSVTALTDQEVWLEIEALTNASFPVSKLTTDEGTLLGTATNQTTSTATWVTTGLTNPNKQKLEVTFTPQIVGIISARVHVAKASQTLWVDPFITLS